MALGFFTGDNTPDSYEARDRKRKLAEALMQESTSTAPIGSWTQGAARLAQALSGKIQENRLNAKDKESNAAFNQVLMSALGGGQSMPSAPAMGGGSAPAPTAGAAPSAPGLPSFAQNPTSLGLIRGFEGYRDKPYWDVNAHRVGYGSDTVTNPDGSVVPVRPGMQINRQQAELDLNRRVSTEFEPRAQKAVGENWAKLPPAAQAALTSITYNYGSLPSSVAAAAQTGDPERIAAAVEGLAGHNGGVNAKRRQQEAAIIRGGGGAPQQTASLDGLPPGPVPSNAPPMAFAGGQPQQQQPQAPQQAPQGQQIMQAVSGPQIPPPQPTGNVQAGMMAVLTDPRFSPQQKQQAMQLIQMQQGQNKATYQTDGDGNIIQLDPSGRQPPRVVYQAKVKPMTVARGGSIFNPQTGQFVTPPAGPGQQAEVGLNPQYGVDEQGNPVLIQLGKDGKGVRTQLPSGVQLSKEPIRIDAGTETILLDPITRQPVGRISKNLSETARQREIGEARGQAEATAPSQISAAEDAISILDQIKTHKGMDNAIGFRSNFPTVKGSDAYGFERLVEQARSGAFLTAIGQLKGMGALSNAEGQTATAAVTRMEIGQSKADFMKALQDYENVVKSGRAKAQRLVQGGSAAPSTPVEAPTADPLGIR